MIELSGPAFAGVDNRLASLKLVQNGLTNAAVFTASGKVVQPSDVFYKKCILVQRGSFRPATKVTVDMLRGAMAQFVQEPGVDPRDLVVVFEMTLKNLRAEGDVNRRSGLSRSRGHPGDAWSHRAHLELRRVPSSRRVPLPVHEEDDRPGDGRPDAARNRSRTSTTATSTAAFSSRSAGCSRTRSRSTRTPSVRPTPARSSRPAICAPRRISGTSTSSCSRTACSRAFVTSTTRACRFCSRDVLARLRSGDPAWEAMVPPRSLT